ncbi:GH32 C-terminal domain-containing protein [Isoptericola sp. BMS4]|uniref:GH32 C-terminal domain-containing protein n=1 Tax=Isoptericola sp. BMS4 TaxID=2527875 RepID=UPI00142351FA|nr:GH32 C-terminal domain-containing protein [Isoptericola sp. BMS4]
MSETTYYRPAGAWVGDVIPVGRDDAFWLYYLHERRETPSAGMPWHLVVTDDLVRYEDRGLAVPSGGPDAPDLNVYTGSVVTDDDGTHHLFYTGQNPDRCGADGRPLQLVMHAVSTDDMRTWTKLPEDTFGAGPGYETGDWRDPFVLRDDAAGLWRMIVTARHDAGPQRRRGVLAQLTSHDLRHWEPVGPLWDPGRHVAHECPDVFRWGDWWYLVYSEFSDAFATRYRMARSLAGPWVAPERDTIDGRSFYAAKSAERDGRRVFFGWIATREGGHDDGPWEWAGTLATLEARRHDDGTLGFAIPAEVLDSFAEPLPVTLGDAGEAAVGRPDGYDAVLADGDVPDRYRVRLDVEIPADATGRAACAETGLLLHASDDGDEAWALRLEPRRGRLVLDRWPRRRTGGEQWQISGDVPHAVELERPCDLRAGRHRLDVVVDGEILQATLDGDVSLSTRVHRRAGDRIGVFAADGVVRADLAVTTRGDRPAPEPVPAAVAATS